jgi:hypothetical protein
VMIIAVCLPGYEDVSQPLFVIAKRLSGVVAI